LAVGGSSARAIVLSSDEASSSDVSSSSDEDSEEGHDGDVENLITVRRIEHEGALVWDDMQDNRLYAESAIDEICPEAIAVVVARDKATTLPIRVKYRVGDPEEPFHARAYAGVSASLARPGPPTPAPAPADHAASRHAQDRGRAAESLADAPLAASISDDDESPADAPLAAAISDADGDAVDGFGAEDTDGAIQEAGRGTGEGNAASEAPEAVIVDGRPEFDAARDTRSTADGGTDAAHHPERGRFPALASPVKVEAAANAALTGSEAPTRWTPHRAEKRFGALDLGFDDDASFQASDGGIRTHSDDGSGDEAANNGPACSLQRPTAKGDRTSISPPKSKLTEGQRHGIVRPIAGTSAWKAAPCPLRGIKSRRRKRARSGARHGRTWARKRRRASWQAPAAALARRRCHGGSASA
jgi:hypothetical protein